MVPKGGSVSDGGWYVLVMGGMVAFYKKPEKCK